MSLFDDFVVWISGPVAHEGRATHAVWLVACLVFVSGAFALRPGDTVADGVSLGSGGLVGVCMSREALGLDCPFCGMTRAFVFLAHGRFDDSLGANRAGVPLFVFMLWVAAFRGISVWRPWRQVKGVEAAARRVVPVLLLLLLAVNWVFRAF